jgi:hypothetical protein
LLNQPQAKPGQKNDGGWSLPSNKISLRRTRGLLDNSLSPAICLLALVTFPIAGKVTKRSSLQNAGTFCVVPRGPHRALQAGALIVARFPKRRDPGVNEVRCVHWLHEGNGRGVQRSRPSLADRATVAGADRRTKTASGERGQVSCRRFTGLC